MPLDDAVPTELCSTGPAQPEGTRSAFVKDLEQVINKHSMENASNTPDFILAQFVLHALDAYAKATQAREQWYGKSLRIGSCCDNLTELYATGPAPHSCNSGPDQEKPAVDT